MLARLDELEAGLLTRRARAEAERWLGEIEGINLTLDFLRSRREDTRRRTQRPAVDLGIPVMRPGRRRRGHDARASTSGQMQSALAATGNRRVPAEGEDHG